MKTKTTKTLILSTIAALVFSLNVNAQTTNDADPQGNAANTSAAQAPVESSTPAPKAARKHAKKKHAKHKKAKRHHKKAKASAEE